MSLHIWTLSNVSYYYWFMSYCEEHVGMHMLKTLGEVWNGWFVFGDIMCLLPTPCGEHGWLSVQQPFFFPNGTPVFCRFGLHDWREDGPILSQKQIKTCLVHCGNLILFVSGWYRRGHVTQFFPVRDEERWAGGVLLSLEVSPWLS